jgi:hypothetical protein
MAAIDTHTIVKELISSGVKEREAEVIVSNFVSKSEFLELERDRLGLATKSDLTEIKYDLLKCIIPFLLTIILLMVGLLLK